jgi:hypothetical protein
MNNEKQQFQCSSPNFKNTGLNCIEENTWRPGQRGTNPAMKCQVKLLAMAHGKGDQINIEEFFWIFFCNPT